MEKLKAIQDEIDTIILTIKLSGFPYIFVVSDDGNIRNYFINNIRNLDNVITIDDSEIESDVPLIEALTKKNVLLLNVDSKAKELKKMVDSMRNKETSYNSLYYRLVLKREFLWKHKKSIIVVSDEKTIVPLIQENQSLASTSVFHFVDDYIKEQENVKKLTKK